MKIHNKFNKQEYIIYAIIIVLMFIIPTVSNLFHGHDIDDTQFLWNDTVKNFKSIAIFVLALAVHDVFIAPLLVYKHKVLAYFVGFVILLGVFYGYKCATHPKEPTLPPAVTESRVLPPQPPGIKNMPKSTKNFSKILSTNLFCQSCNK